MYFLQRVGCASLELHLIDRNLVNLESYLQQEVSKDMNGELQKCFGDGMQGLTSQITTPPQVLVLARPLVDESSALSAHIHFILRINTAAKAIDRQNSLLELAKRRMRHLSLIAERYDSE